ncbi:MAG: RNA methyltransferase, partial [Hyphomicrobiaceae bacterium]
MTDAPQTGVAVRVRDGEPHVGGSDATVATVVHACHNTTIDQGLESLAIAGLDRETLEPVLEYCASLACEADGVTCPGCKRRTEALGWHTLDDYVRAHKEIVVGDGAVRLVGLGALSVATPALAALEKTWSGENYWFWARRVIRKLRHGIRRAHIQGHAVHGSGESPAIILMEPQLA